MNHSLWRVEDKEKFPRLAQDLQAEAVVIGGGMAGVLTVRLLQEKGVRAVLLEADRLGSGQTGNTTAKITAQHGQIYARLIREVGEEAARQYAQANQRAVKTYGRLVRALRIDCDWTECPAYLYTQAEEDPLREEAHAARQLGLDVIFTTETELPFSVKGAVRMNGQARFHPMRFLSSAAHGLEIYEHTRVCKAERDRVITEGGYVKAKHIIFASHYPFVNRHGFYFMRLHQTRSYVVALEKTQVLKGMYYGVDPGGLSLRPANGCLLLGGAGHRTGENQMGGRYRILEEAAKRLWPDCQVKTRWSAQDCMSADGIPYIGRYADSMPEWYVATGFNKWGMTGSMVAAMALSDRITGRDTTWAEVFSPQRFPLRASAPNLLEDGRQAVKGLSRALAVPPKAKMERLPEGHGGIVEWDSHKVGVYRDERGKEYMISPRCSHLGCQVEWNPDEKSWECPCHGSRFDYQGRLICGPAQRDLEQIGSSVDSSVYSQNT